MGSRTRSPAGRPLMVFAVLVLICFASVPHVQAVPLVDEPAPGQVLNVAVHPLDQAEPTVVAHKVALLEVFTATWCPPCAPSHRAIERLMDEMEAQTGTGDDTGPAAEDRLAVLSYHPFPDVGGEDPFGIPEGHDRLAKKHNVFWFPSAFVDGVLKDAPETRSIQVDVGMEETLWASYKGLVERAHANDAPFVLRVESERAGPQPDDTMKWIVHVEIEAKRTIETPMFLQGVLWEDPVLFPGSSGVDRHRMVVRAMAPQQAIGPLDAGQTYNTSFSVVAPSAVDPDKAGVSVFVETQWGQERDTRAGTLFLLAVFVAGGTGVTAAWQIRGKDRARARKVRENTTTGSMEREG